MTKKQPEWEKKFDKKFTVKDDWLVQIYPYHIKQFISKLRQQAIRETLGKIDYLKEAEKFEKEMTSGLGLANIHGMGNVHLFAQKLTNLINKLKEEK